MAPGVFLLDKCFANLWARPMMVGTVGRSSAATRLFSILTALTRAPSLIRAPAATADHDRCDDVQTLLGIQQTHTLRIPQGSKIGAIINLVPVILAAF